MNSITQHLTGLIKTKEAAHLLGVTVQTIKNYIYLGKLKSYKTPGGHHRVLVSDLQELAPIQSIPSREELLEQYDHLYQSYLDTIGALLNALDARDGIASGHSRRVANYACAMGNVLGFPPNSQRTLELAALLHDVGKIMIGEQILGKPGKLTDQETYIIRQHPEMGERIVGEVDFLRDTKPFIRHHHERFDGKGYPDNLSGEGIPLEARIIFIAEAFDSLRSDSSYHRSLNFKEALSEIEQGAGTQFDPQILKIFIENVKKGSMNEMGLSGGSVSFNNGQRAHVV
ncbi:MAG: HD-GYP domain-containing protein [Syntrophobacterales bacterium]|nr:MAG: HD-GYP domain-containing protein [Syntrophobacterales bacterium]